jgi:UDP-glucose 4-epimerase
MIFKPNKVLVTGGAGFIGSHLCTELLARGINVIVLDDLSTGRRENLAQQINFVQGDVRDPALLLRVLDGVEAVFHLAAKVSVRASVQSFYEDAQTNVMGTLALLDALRGSNVRKLILASSMAVYTDSPAGSAVTEGHPAQPASPYGIGKLASEYYCLNIAPHLGIEPLALRFFNTYGVGQAYTPYVGVITIFLKKLMAGESPVIFGDGLQTRDFVSVKDIVHGCIRALEVGPGGEVFNLGSGRGCSVNELAGLISTALGSALPFAHVPAHPGEICNSVADITKARELLDYSPQGRLADDLAGLIEYYAGGLRH